MRLAVGDVGMFRGTENQVMGRVLHWRGARGVQGLRRAASLLRAAADVLHGRKASARILLQGKSGRASPSSRGGSQKKQNHKIAEVVGYCWGDLGDVDTLWMEEEKVSKMLHKSVSYLQADEQ
ncbi:hypothetical protein NDU88_003183 [Pleurodeles waltl]|uniref:Uncharacterized protein n=1 Tax=Pleurodeles waltl TaxID=8319 RepID=A0AAV7M386_PLEWA|nr:hypothetical protein NDU88_003183 [Pleurodeles waltl]